jgi:uncharacterized protein YyaL (SSP411 family)
MPNRLEHETSPYLLQHKDNPVDWYPWGDDAFTRARAENKPVLLSIGYSSCHWCHVMAHESFEDPAIARQLNDSFISIKVDREERPDIDAIYMNALQAMSGQGGWPLNVFLTPDAVPFFGGTYWPPTDMRGMPGFPRVLDAIQTQWNANRQGIDNTAQQILDFLQKASATVPSGPTSSLESVPEQALIRLLSRFDEEFGGLQGAPKFPQASILEFLLRHHRRTGSTDALRMVDVTLDHMASGGIYDQLGGGFSRYSVDAEWLVPHFEKMLYDNAQLMSLYLDTWRLTGNARFRTIVTETADWLLREMQDPAGGFYSALDADSEGVEGKFYVWEDAELDTLLTPDEADVVRLHYGVTPEGNFEEKSILFIDRELDDLATASGKSLEHMSDLLESAREKLLNHRDTRVRPGTDTKVIVSWNGLAISALARAGAVLDNPVYVESAERAASRICDTALSESMRLNRTLSASGPAGEGVLEDYAFLAYGLLDLHAATRDQRWLNVARQLADTILERFSDAVGFFDTASDHETLIVRPREFQDGATPSGNSVALDVLLTLEHLTSDPRYGEPVPALLNALAAPMAEHPSILGRFLAVLERTQADARQLVIAGENPVPLLEPVLQAYEPFVTIAWPVDDQHATRWPTLAGHHLPNDNDTAAFLCQGNSCLPPITSASNLRSALEREFAYSTPEATRIT